jgi:hypothetical protein
VNRTPGLLEIALACLTMLLVSLSTTFFVPALPLPKQTTTSEETLEQDFTDPLSTLPQLIYTRFIFASYLRNARSNQPSDHQTDNSAYPTQHATSFDTIGPTELYPRDGS